MNWEIFDTEGNLFITEETKKEKKIYRDIYTNENQNSLGVLLFVITITVYTIPIHTKFVINRPIPNLCRYSVTLSILGTVVYSITVV